MVVAKNISIRRGGDIWSQVEFQLGEAPAAYGHLLTPHQIADLLVSTIIQIESGGNPRLIGSKGERGLMQIMPQTWTEITALRYGKPLSFELAFDAVTNEQVGRWYLDYLQHFLNAHRSEWKADERALLLAAYNGGPNRLAHVQFDVRRLPASVRDYVQRGVNLHDYLLAEQAQTVRYMLNSASLTSPQREQL
jgi:hypothetical protein